MAIFASAQRNLTQGFSSFRSNARGTKQCGASVHVVYHKCLLIRKLMQAISAEAVSEATVDTGVSGDSFTVNEHMGGTSGLRRHCALAG